MKHDAIASWHLIQYMADPRRREPRNIGIAVETPDGWLLKFIAEESDGRINGQKLRSQHVKKDVYESWIQYYRRKALAGNWDEVEHFHSRRPGNFTTALAGRTWEPERDWSAFVDRLYVSLIEEERPPQPMEIFRSKVDRVFDIAGIVPTREVLVPGKWSPSSEEVNIPFDFGYQNGQYHVMDAVTLGRRQSITDFKARLDAVERARVVKSCIAFYETPGLDEGQIDEALRPLEDGAHPIPVDDEEKAAEMLLELMPAH